MRDLFPQFNQLNFVALRITTESRAVASVLYSHGRICFEAIFSVVFVVFRFPFCSILDDFSITGQYLFTVEIFQKEREPQTSIAPALK